MSLNKVLHLALIIPFVFSCSYRAYMNPSGGMEPILYPADRFITQILDNKSWTNLKRDDILIFWAPPSMYVGCLADYPKYPPYNIKENKKFIKRLIAFGGEAVHFSSSNIIIYSNGNNIFYKDTYGYYKDDSILSKYIGSHTWYIPKKGDKIVFILKQKNINFTNEKLYDVIINGNKVGMPMKQWHYISIYMQYSSNEIQFEYICPEDYYFFLGDNREASCDSRYWGCVPKGFITERFIKVFWGKGAFKY